MLSKVTRQKAKQAVVRVDTGRGFILDTAPYRLIVTAAHCLPCLPLAAAFASLEERTFQNILAPLGEQNPTVWAECLFADPVADIAVLGRPDDQELWDKVEAYEALTGKAAALRISDPPDEGTAWLLGLNNRWGKCVARHVDGPLWLSEAADDIDAGMSGSPILSDNGTAIGVIGTGVLGTSGGSGDEPHQQEENH